MKHYRAPWSTSLKVITFSASVLLLGTSLSVWFTRLPAIAFWQLLLLPLILLLAGACFTVSGYVIEPDAIVVRRLFWATRLPRTGLKAARFQPGATRGSIRTFGNGGLFSFTGFYRNKLLGSYRAFVTDAGRAVVLEYSDRTVVVSPDPPEDFVRELQVPLHSCPGGATLPATPPSSGQPPATNLRQNES